MNCLACDALKGKKSCWRHNEPIVNTIDKFPSYKWAVGTIVSEHGNPNNPRWEITGYGEMGMHLVYHVARVDGRPCSGVITLWEQDSGGFKEVA